MGNKYSRSTQNATAISSLSVKVVINGRKTHPQLRPSSWKLKYYMHDTWVVAPFSLRATLLPLSESLKHPQAWAIFYLLKSLAPEAQHKIERRPSCLKCWLLVFYSSRKHMVEKIKAQVDQRTQWLPSALPRWTIRLCFCRCQRDKGAGLRRRDLAGWSVPQSSLAYGTLYHTCLFMHILMDDFYIFDCLIVSQSILRKLKVDFKRCNHFQKSFGNFVKS